MKSAVPSPSTSATAGTPTVSPSPAENHQSSFPWLPAIALPEMAHSAAEFRQAQTRSPTPSPSRSGAGRPAPADPVLARYASERFAKYSRALYSFNGKNGGRPALFAASFRSESQAAIAAGDGGVQPVELNCQTDWAESAVEKAQRVLALAANHLPAAGFELHHSGRFAPAERNWVPKQLLLSPTVKSRCCRVQLAVAWFPPPGPVSTGAAVGTGGQGDRFRGRNRERRHDGTVFDPLRALPPPGSALPSSTRRDPSCDW